MKREVIFTPLSRLFPVFTFIFMLMIAVDASATVRRLPRDSMLHQIDRAGYLWDIGRDGEIKDATGHLFDVGLHLYVGGKKYHSEYGHIHWDDGTQEFVFPKARIGEFLVHRRVLINPDGGYGRWLEVIENTGTEDRSLTVELYSRLGAFPSFFRGIQGIDADQKEANFTIIGQAGRPLLGRIFHGAFFKDRFRLNIGEDSRSIKATYMDIQIPAKDTAIIQHYVIQNGSMTAMAHIISAINETPSTDLKHIANYTLITDDRATDQAMVGMPDILMTQQGDLLSGSLAPDTLSIVTDLGEFKISHHDLVVMQIRRSPGKNYIISTRHGEQLVGLPTTEKLGFRTKKEFFLVPIKNLSRLIRPLLDARAPASSSHPYASFSTTDRILVRVEEDSLSIQTRYGDMNIPLKDVVSASFQKNQDVQLTLIYPANITGRFKDKGIYLKLRDQDVQFITVDRIDHIRMLYEMPESSMNVHKTTPSLGLDNGNSFFGQMAGTHLVVQIRTGIEKFKPEDIAHLAAKEHGLHSILTKTGKLHVGRILTKKIRFTLKAGPEIFIRPDWIRTYSTPDYEGAYTLLRNTGFYLMERFLYGSPQESQQAHSDILSFGESAELLFGFGGLPSDHEKLQKLREEIETLSAKPFPGETPPLSSVIQSDTLPTNPVSDTIPRYSVVSTDGTFQYGNRLFRNGQYMQARNAYLFVMTSLDPDMFLHLEASFMAARAGHEMGDLEFAKNTYEKIIHGLANYEKILKNHPVEPVIPETMLELGDVYIGLDMRSSAKAIWRQLIQEYGNSAAAELAKKRLESMSTPLNILKTLKRTGP